MGKIPNNLQQICKIIRTLVKLHPCKNACQKAFKDLTFKLEMEVFGIKHKRRELSARKLSKYKSRELKTISEYGRIQHKPYADNTGKMQMHKKIQSMIWAAKDIILGPKYVAIEKTTITYPIIPLQGTYLQTQKSLRSRH